MPWNRESPMDQRVKLIHDWLSGSYSKSQLSRCKTMDLHRSIHRCSCRISRELNSLTPLIVPMLRVGMPQRTLCVRSWDAERPELHSHAERGNDQCRVSLLCSSAVDC